MLHRNARRSWLTCVAFKNTTHSSSRFVGNECVRRVNTCATTAKSGKEARISLSTRRVTFPLENAARCSEMVLGDK